MNDSVAAGREITPDMRKNGEGWRPGRGSFFFAGRRGDMYAAVMIRIVFLGYALSIGLTAAAAVAPAAREVHVGTVDRSPVIDGHLTEPLWKRSPDFAGFTELQTLAGAQPPTEAWIARSTDWLFLGFLCHEPDPDAIRTDIDTRDGPVYRDDSVEVFIGPGDERKTYYHFKMNAAGVQADSYIVNGRKQEWDFHWRSAARIDRDRRRWTAEIAIPLFYLTKLKSSGAWAFNLTRSKPGRVWFSWSPNKLRDFHNTDCFGTLPGLAPLAPERVYAPVVADLERSPYTETTDRFYTVTTELQNDGVRPGPLQLRIKDVAADAIETTGPFDVTLNKGRTVRTYKVSVDDFVPSRTRVTASFEDALGRWSVTQEIVQKDIQQPYAFFMGRSYYTDERQGGVGLSVRVPFSAVDGSTVRITVAGQTTTRHVRQLQQLFPFPIGLLEPDDYPVNVSLEASDGQVIHAETLELVKKLVPEKGNIIKEDAWNRCVLLNGQPFLPYGFLTRKVDLGYYAGVGFNALLDWPIKTTPEELHQLLKACEEHGLHAMLWTIRGLTVRSKKNAELEEKLPVCLQEELPAIVSKTLHSPALLAYMTFDEPGGDTLAALHASYYAALKGMAPTIPVTVNMCGALRPEFKTDIGLLDIYWGGDDKNPMSMRHYLDFYYRMHKDVQRTDKPVWLISLGETCSGSARIQTPAEQRVSTYMGVIYGASGIYYFRWPPRHSASVGMYSRMAEELQALTPALCSRPPLQSVQVESGDSEMFHMALRHMPGGDLALIVANAYDVSGTVSIAFDGLDEGCDVGDFFTGTRLPLQDRALVDSFSGYAVKVYRIAKCPLDPRRNVVLAVNSKMQEDTRSGKENLMPPFTGDDWEGPVVFDESVSDSGERSIRLAREADQGHVRIQSRAFELEPGTAYEFSARIKGEFDGAPEGFGGPRVMLYSVDRGKVILHFQTHARHLKNWRVYRRDVESLPGTRETVKCILLADADKYVGSAWFDKLVLVERTPEVTSRNRRSNSSFEIATMPGLPDRWEARPWFDAVQVEKGTQPSDYVRDSYTLERQH